MRKNKEDKIKDTLDKISKESFYHEYIELNRDKSDIVSQYSLNSFDWAYFIHDCGFKKSYNLSRRKSVERGKVKRLNQPSCKNFILTHIEEIQQLINNNFSILDMFNYFQEKYNPRWHDYPTFGVLFRKIKNKFVFPKGYFNSIDTKRITHRVNTVINKSPDEKLKTYQKYKKTMDSKSEQEKQLIRKQIQQTKLSYGKSWMDNVVEKCLETKRKNNSFNISNEEEFVCDFLDSLYGINRQYKDKQRYPYACDIYVPVFDMFIEINTHWTHGKHPYNKESKEDIERLQIIRERQAYRKSKTGLLKKNSYFVAENVWTIKDPKKLQTAIENKLNYVVIYNLSTYNMYEICKWDFSRLLGINIIDMNNCDYLKTENVNF